MIEITDFEDRLPQEWRPVSTAQQAALDSPADMLLFGGAAGGGKSEFVLVDGLELYDQKNYHAVVFRRTFPELQQLMDRSKQLFQGTGAVFNQSDKVWRWPWGATFEFKYLERDDDIYKRQGAEYHYVAFDESTHFMEKQVRYVVQSRMRSKEGYRLKVRFTTNPGNRGATWHKKVWIGPKCLHCLEASGVKNWPATSRRPYVLYHDAAWMDGVPTGMSTMFIPSKVTDHNLFGEAGGSYAKKLRGLPVAFQKALLEGCWDAFEGQYFDCWDYNAHIFDEEQTKELGIKNWWPKWVSIDYGFSLTHATVAYLWTKSPEDIIYTLDEYIIHRRMAADVASDLQLLWGAEMPKAWYLSPDAFKHDGTNDFSRAELMTQATGIGFDEAYNDRVSGAMLMYQLLRNFQWRISTRCPLLIASLPSRVHGEDAKAEDVLKTEEDEDDSYDACRYGCASHIRAGRRPMQEELMEQVTSEDPTIAMMQYQLALNKIRNKTQPIKYTNRARSR